MTLLQPLAFFFHIPAQTTAHSPESIFISWNLRTRYLFSYLWFMGHLSREKCSVQLISAQTSRAGIKFTNSKVLLKSYCLIYIMCPRPKQRPTQQHQLPVDKWRSLCTVVNFPKFEALWQFSRCGLCYRFPGIWFWSHQLLFFLKLSNLELLIIVILSQ